MTPREYMHLKRVWAQREASFHNAHFRTNEQIPFLAEDFISSGSRVQRQATALREKADVMMERQRLDMMKTGDGGEVPLMFREIGPVN